MQGLSRERAEIETKLSYYDRMYCIYQTYLVQEVQGTLSSIAYDNHGVVDAYQTSHAARSGRRAPFLDLASFVCVSLSLSLCLSPSLLLHDLTSHECLRSRWRRRLRVVSVA